MRLKKLLKFLKGSKANIAKGQLAPIEKTEVITSAQELIDIIENGWSTPKEFIHIYSLLCNAELVGEEREKFIESGRGDEIYASPLIGTIVEDKMVDKEHLSSVKKLNLTG